MKKLLLLLCTLCACLTLVACNGAEDECSHAWVDATCTTPKTCSKCQETEGEAIGHSWLDPTCTAPKTCSACQATEGSANGHTWLSATCTLPKTCSVCQSTEGSANGHDWLSATCTEPKTCSVCDETRGSHLGHAWLDATCTEPETCQRCDATQGTSRGHSYNEQITVPATSVTLGTKKLTCSACSASHTESYSAPILSSEQVYEIAEKSVGEILVYNKQGVAFALGTVFVISEDGRLLTNYHVIEGGYSAVVTLDGASYEVNYILAYDKDIDLAVLKIDASGLSPVTLMAEGVKGGATVYAVGSSEGYTLSFSTGVVASPDRVFDNVHYIQHEAAISSGNSGGPLFNAYGEVIGINTLTNIDGQNLNFAIAAKEIDNLVYGNSMTFAEYYEAECDVFTNLKNYIIQNGVYLSSQNCYRLTLGNTYSSDYTTKYTRLAYYYVDDDEITLDFLIDDGEYWVYFTLDEALDGSYYWSYFDDFGYKMSGTLYASTYDSDTLLGYSSNNVSSSSTRASVRELASTMISVLCSWIDYDFSDIGVTAEDLQFYYY
ncbi:MAG: trypsin-like peptidase domain-containing protein [Clostridia bacterium]|nr:trypsin-like peptidase domain-containing protein [Clostridia bacterium]